MMQVWGRDGLGSRSQRKLLFLCDQGPRQLASLEQRTACWRCNASWEWRLLGRVILLFSREIRLNSSALLKQQEQQPPPPDPTGCLSRSGHSHAWGAEISKVDKVPECRKSIVLFSVGIFQTKKEGLWSNRRFEIGTIRKNLAS